MGIWDLHFLIVVVIMIFVNQNLLNSFHCPLQQPILSSGCAMCCHGTHVCGVQERMTVLLAEKAVHLAACILIF